MSKLINTERVHRGGETSVSNSEESSGNKFVCFLGGGSNIFSFIRFKKEVNIYISQIIIVKVYLTKTVTWSFSTSSFRQIRQ